MERCRPPERDASRAPSTPARLLRDVSNLKTPRPCPRIPYPNPNLASPSSHFFTASKKTPHSSYHTPISSTSHSIFRHGTPSVTGSASRSKTARRLNALEIEQTRSARKAQSHREKKVACFARSLGAWLNFLLQNPKACGCKIGFCEADGQPMGSISKGKGKRSFDIRLSVAKPTMTSLDKSLCKVCSLEDMCERMTLHMSSKGCNGVLLMMSQVCKNIDEGRLKMKPHCPLVTDLAVKERAIKTLMCYNPLWLKKGLHILFGGDSLLLNHGDLDGHFLKKFLEKHFFTYAGIASTHKLVGDFYRPGYYEALGKVILKRFLLLSITLDKAKCESSLPINYGVDSIDGGSPLLFNLHSSIKSTRQIINEFLMDSMHGEGDLLSHLVTMGYKVNYQQSPLCECDFKVKNIFEDLQNGILLCRVVQLLLCNETILSKMVCPSDTPKKKLQNCSTAMKHLKDSGVRMSDSDGLLITAADLVNGEKELTCSLLWNVFICLQVPLLINKTSLLTEIAKIKGTEAEFMKYDACNEMNLLFRWIQAVCAMQNLELDGFSSLTDGKALTCLIKFYLGNDIHPSSVEKENKNERNYPPTLFGIQYVQHVTAMLGNYPEWVLHLCDIFDEDEDQNIDEKTAVILLVFLAFRLISTDKLQLCVSLKYPKISGNNAKKLCCSHGEDLARYLSEESSARVIQARYRGFLKRKCFLKMKITAIFLQSVIRAWLAVRFDNESKHAALTCSPLRSTNGIYDRYLSFLIERQKFRKARNAVILIQRYARAWIKRKHHNSKLMILKISGIEIPGAVDFSHSSCCNVTKLEIMLKPSANDDKNETLEQQWRAVTKIQEAWKNFQHNIGSKRNHSATKIQSQWRRWLIRKDYLFQVEAIKLIQSVVRSSRTQSAFQQKQIATIEIQRFIRGQLARTKLLGASSHEYITLHRRSYDAISDGFMNNVELRILHYSIVKLQRWWKRLLLHRSRRHAAISIQSIARNWIARRAAAKRKQSISIIQRLWKNILLTRMKKNSIIVIQTCIRSWLTHQNYIRKTYCIFKIQSCWKGYMVRKHARPQLFSLRQRMEMSAANVNEEMRLINRLVAALSELLGYKSISNIRHTCETLDKATELSQKCCETLVDAGAIDILLKKIQLLNRGIPDQEVLKHLLSTLRNIARYKHLSLVLINAPKSMEIIFQEMLRNKNEGFIISCQLLRRVCEIQEGLHAVRNLSGHIKRLNNLLLTLDRKAKFLEREALRNKNRDLALKWLREGACLMSTIADE